MSLITEINWEKVGGLIPVIVQDSRTQKVLMLGYMNDAALSSTLDTHKVTVWSRTKQRLWMKGESSGNVQIVKSLHIDCDKDAIVAKIQQVGGAACHASHSRLPEPPPRKMRKIAWWARRSGWTAAARHSGVTGREEMSWGDGMLACTTRQRSCSLAVS